MNILRVILICDSKASSSFSSNNKIASMYIVIWFYFYLWTVQNYIFNLKTINYYQKLSIKSAMVPLSFYFSAFLSLTIRQEISCWTNSPEIARNCTMMKIRESREMWEAHIFTMIKVKKSISNSVSGCSSPWWNRLYKVHETLTFQKWIWTRRKLAKHIIFMYKAPRKSQEYS